MHAGSLGLGAALALAANAILIPPTADVIDVEAIQHGHPLINPESESIRVECPGCPFAVKNAQDGSTVWTTDVKNFLELDMKIRHEGGDALYIGDVAVYPPEFGMVPKPVTVAQIRAAEGTMELVKNTGLQVTGMTFRFDPATTVSVDGLELIPINVRIFSLERQPVSPPNVTVVLLKDVSGGLHIASVLKEKASPVTTDLEACLSWPSICKLKSISFEKFQKIKAYFGKPCHQRTRPQPGHFHDIIPPHMQTNGRRPHHRPHHAQEHRRVQSFFHTMVHTILIPILFGMAVGAITYATGMLLGTGIAFIWAAIRGTSSQGYASLPEDEEQISEKEAEAYADAELPADSPPVYKEIPEKE